MQRDGLGLGTKLGLKSWIGLRLAVILWLKSTPGLHSTTIFRIPHLARLPIGHSVKSAYVKALGGDMNRNVKNFGGSERQKIGCLPCCLSRQQA